MNLHHSRIVAARLFAAFMLTAGAACALAGVHYVGLNSTNATPPFTNWVTAATNIQDAVDAAVAGDEIVVTNGTYHSVSVLKPLSVRSVNGPELTIINGGGAARCVTLIGSASLSGFTLTNGKAQYGGGAFGGTLNNCTVSGNSAFGGEVSAYGGGAAYCALDDCILTGNTATGSRGMGYPVRIDVYGGGAYECTLDNCTLTGNSAQAPLGEVGEYGGGASDCTLKNCTLTGNSAYYGGGVYRCVLNNCVVYFNRLENGTPFWNHPSSLSYCCTTPQPVNGVGNITNAPLFVDTNGWANLRLQSNSPCINAGNNSDAVGGADLDGNPRIAGGTVDIGAYEYQWPQLTITPSGTNVILSWPISYAAGYYLQVTVNLGDAAGWVTTVLPQPPIIVNGQYVVTIPNAVVGNHFYRLSQ